MICEQDNHGARNAFHTLKACLLRKAKLQEFIEALQAVGLTELADRMVNGKVNVLQLHSVITNNYSHFKRILF